MKLISCTDFVISQHEKLKDAKGTKAIEVVDLGRRIHEYAKFLQRPLELGMFEPCGEDGRILPLEKSMTDFELEEDYDLYINKIKEAKARVVFEGLHLDSNPAAVWCPKCWIFLCNVDTIEDLVAYDLTLIETKPNK